tara:strand:- start:370 stop:624 length:255 start_codon:yes stop_codon:yes gene_type:complete
MTRFTKWVDDVAVNLTKAELEYVDDREKAEQFRYIRDDLLSETDWWAVADRTMTDAEKNYRSLLRFVPQQAGFPTTISWPTKPE